MSFVTMPHAANAPKHVGTPEGADSGCATRAGSQNPFLSSGHLLWLHGPQPTGKGKNRSLLRSHYPLSQSADTTAGPRPRPHCRFCPQGRPRNINCYGTAEGGLRLPNPGATEESQDEEEGGFPLLPNHPSFLPLFILDKAQGLFGAQSFHLKRWR